MYDKGMILYRRKWAHLRISNVPATSRKKVRAIAELKDFHAITGTFSAGIKGFFGRPSFEVSVLSWSGYEDSHLQGSTGYDIASLR